MKLIYYISLFLSVFATSCSKKKTNEEIDNTKRKVLVLNEGNFMFGNAEMSVYHPISKELVNGVFEKVNDFKLGDVAQSMLLFDSLLFVAVNNSSKVDVLHASSLKHIYSINISGSSPRYCYADASYQKLYITELYANKIHIVNLNNFQVIGSITTQGWTESIAAKGNFIYTIQRRKPGGQKAASILKIDRASSTISNTVPLPADPSNFGFDYLNNIWAMHGSDTAQGVSAAQLHQIDLNSFSIIKTVSFPQNMRPSNFRLHPDGQSCFYTIGKQVFQWNLSNTDLPTSPLFVSEAALIYNLDIDPYSRDIYLSDAIDYVQPSKIYRYDESGKLIHSFTAGVISNEFCFYAP
jgi:hypothetical protein